MEECGYCLSTLQCVRGTVDGPLEKSYPCPSWTFVQDGCTGKNNTIFNKSKISLEVPNCGGFLDCGSCAQKEACAWCASENVCVTISEAFSRDCGGLVFDLPCPDSYVSGIASSFFYADFSVFQRMLLLVI